MASRTYCINYQDILKASHRIAGIARQTPILTAPSLDRLLIQCPEQLEQQSSSYSPRLFFKNEAFQRTGSFKFRGALNTIRFLAEQRWGPCENESYKKVSAIPLPSRKDDVLHIVTHSSGNHSAALAHAASVVTEQYKRWNKSQGKTIALKVSVTAVMPFTAPQSKRDATASYGANVIVVDSDDRAVRQEEAERIRRKFIEDTAHDSEEATPSAVVIHPFEDSNVIAGQGTVGLETWHQVKALLQEDEILPSVCDKYRGETMDGIIIPVGGGALAAGCALALREIAGDKVKIILAEPEVLDDCKRSLEQGTLLPHEPGNPLKSIADGLKATMGETTTWPMIRDLVDDVITVSERDILRSTQLLWERLKVCVEPSASVGLAVALSPEFADRYLGGGVSGKGKCLRNIGVVLCGGNCDVVKVAQQMIAFEGK